jgi:hypothetical protein
MFKETSCRKCACSRDNSCNSPYVEYRISLYDATITVGAHWGNASSRINVEVNGESSLLLGGSQVADYRHKPFEALISAAHEYLKLDVAEGDDESEEDKEARKQIKKALENRIARCCDYE